MPVPHPAAPHQRPIRVLQVVLSLHPGGTERLVVDLATRLGEEVQTAICCLDAAGAWGESLAASGTPVTMLGRRPGFHPMLGVRIAGLAAQHRADVIHCHQYSPFVYGCVATFLRPTTLVFTEHGRLADVPPSRKRWIANQALARMPDHVCAVSADLKLHLQAEGFPSSRVRVLYNGIDLRPAPGAPERTSARARLEVDEDAVVLMTVGRLDPVKDYATLIRAFALVRPRVPAARLVVIGDGPDRQAIEHAIADTGVASSVLLLGHREDVRDLLPGADVFVNSSIFEGVSLTILEAMAAGLPVVATSAGGNPEVVTEATGMIVPPRDPERMAEALVAIAGDFAMRRRLGTAARADVESRFSLDRMLRDYLAIYRGQA